MVEPRLNLAKISLDCDDTTAALRLVRNLNPDCIPVDITRRLNL